MSNETKQGVEVDQVWKGKPPRKERVRVERVWDYQPGLGGTIPVARCHPLNGGKPLVIGLDDLRDEYELELADA